jgi:hypothetical protein
MEGPSFCVDDEDQIVKAVDCCCQVCRNYRARSGVETCLFYSTTKNLIMKLARIENIAQVAHLHGSWI